jgi:hypothetical protein
MSTRAKCRVCKKTFTPTFIFDAATPAAPPSSLPAPPPAVSLSEPLAWNMGNPLVAPPVALPVPPPATPLSEPIAWNTGNPLVAPPVSVTANAPLLSAPPLTADKQRRREKVHDRPVGQLRPYEVALASALILAVLGGLGFLGYQLYSQPKDVAAAGGDEGTERFGGPGDFPSVTDMTLKPRPKKLAGVWELRADDSRTGRLVLRPDGTLTASSTSGDLSLPDYNGNWYLLDEDGDKFVLEFARERGGLDGYKVTLLMTNPEAFTLVETVKGGATVRDYQRFVRATATAPAAKAP